MTYVFSYLMRICVVQYVDMVTGQSNNLGAFFLNFHTDAVFWRPIVGLMHFLDKAQDPILESWVLRVPGRINSVQELKDEVRNSGPHSSLSFHYVPAMSGL